MGYNVDFYLRRMITGRALRAKDRELIDAAREALRRGFRDHRHSVAAAVRTRSGRIYLGLCVEGIHGPCAEPVAIGAAITAGDSQIESMVAVTGPGLYLPCPLALRELSSAPARLRPEGGGSGPIPQGACRTADRGGESSCRLPNLRVSQTGGFPDETRRCLPMAAHANPGPVIGRARLSGA